MAARNPGKEYTEFQEQDLITSNNGQQTNAFDIYCPVDACRCKLLLAKAATLVQREKSKLTLPQLPLAGATVSTIDDSEDTNNTTTTPTTTEEEPTSPTTPTTAGELQAFWRVTDMMAFENIGFSKMLPNGTQFLSCADCDTGPLGYHESKVPRTEKEYLVAINRVRYHDRY
ncbi:hypothetical protein BGZ97_008712 [Linnemannia gamsii]|uniref:Mss4-like protein n=1 Tax=Linnemannia gamsii TaxID=64522 RepID=A0A9P6UEH7_9FUNG|nr:hypothetical protein BGZ97_008712 [Linnemannia gamsii]